MKKLYQITIIIFLGSSLYDPTGLNLNLKYYLLVPAIFMAFFYSLKSRFHFRVENQILLLLFLFPLIAVPSSFYTNAIYQDFIDTSYFAMSLLLIPLLSFDYKSTDFIKSLLPVFYLLLSLSTVLLTLMFLTNSFDNILNFATSNSIAIIAWRGTFGYTLPFIYLLASPLLIFSLGMATIHVQEHQSFKSILLFIVAFAAMILTGSRSNIVLAFVIPVVVFAVKYRILRLSFSILILFSISILLILFFNTTSESVANASDAKRYRIIEEWVKILSQDLYAFWGTGFNFAKIDRDFYSLAKGGSRLELTYFEILRVYGLLAGLVNIILLLLPLLLKDKDIRVRWLYGLYLTNAFFNPYLHSINGVVAIFTVLVFGRKANDNG